MEALRACTRFARQAGSDVAISVPKLIALAYHLRDLRLCFFQSPSWSLSVQVTALVERQTSLQISLDSADQVRCAVPPPLLSCMPSETRE